MGRDKLAQGEMEEILEKATAFITRKNREETELLLFRHPHAGIQIPAGTVEDNESHMDAVIREAKEETGLDSFDVKNYIGFMDALLPENQFVVLRKTKVYARPDLNSFDWAEFRRGINITYNNRKSGNFTHVAYNEGDKFPDPDYVTYSIVGWVPSDCLATKVRRHFYHLEAKDETADIWDKLSDNHVFQLFWAPSSNLPPIVYPQNKWLDYTLNELKYRFV